MLGPLPFGQMGRSGIDGVVYFYNEAIYWRRIGEH